MLLAEIYIAPYPTDRAEARQIAKNVWVRSIRIFRKDVGQAPGTTMLDASPTLFRRAVALGAGFDRAVVQVVVRVHDSAFVPSRIVQGPKANCGRSCS